MPLTLRLREPLSISIEVDAVRLEHLREASPQEIARTPVQQGNRSRELAELFELQGSAHDDQTVVWEGDCSRVDRIGAGMISGCMRVEGDAGYGAGAEMRGGMLQIKGNAGDWAAAEMRGGRLSVSGRAGDFLGSVYPGGRRGMRGGVVTVCGDAGAEVGHRMRRGVIAIGGSCGEAAGHQMIAGTIFVGGACGAYPGAEMRRGSLILFGHESPHLLPTFRRGGIDSPVFLRFYLLQLRKLGFAVDNSWLDAEYTRFFGDFLRSGRGEILMRSEAADA